MITGYRGRLVPDIVAIHGAKTDNQTEIPLEDRQGVDITLVDFTYAHEHPQHLTDRYKEKTSHYLPLKQALLEIGYKSVTIIPIIAGVRGWNPVMCKSALKQLHLTPTRCDKLLTYYTHNAWKSLRPIVGARRRLEREPENRQYSGLYAMKSQKKYKKGYQGEGPRPERAIGT